MLSFYVISYYHLFGMLSFYVISIFEVEDVSENIVQDQVSENIHAKTDVFKYIIMKIPFYASVTEYQ